MMKSRRSCLVLLSLFTLCGSWLTACGSGDGPGVAPADTGSGQPDGIAWDVVANDLAGDLAELRDEDQTGSDMTPEVLAGDSPVPELPEDSATPQPEVLDGQSVDTDNPPSLAYVFAHSATVLYLMDPLTLQATEIGPLVFEDANGQPLSGSDAQMTDFAINRLGDMVGCTASALFQIDPVSLLAHQIAPLEEKFMGLTFVPVGFLDPEQEILVGATNSDGSLYRIDPTTGVATLIGSYGGGWITSGDLVAIQNDGMYATVKQPDTTEDFLARVDPGSGEATIIGNGTGASKLFGLGYWGGTLYGFSANGDIVAIDRASGVGTVVNHLDIAWWGAGVTTVAKTQ